MTGYAYPYTMTIRGIRPPLDNDNQAFYTYHTRLFLLSPNLMIYDRATV